MQTLESKLRAGLSELGLALSDAQVAALLDYLALIQKWTKVYNLTAVRDPDEMLTHHLLDSLAVIAPLRRHLFQPERMQSAGDLTLDNLAVIAPPRRHLSQPEKMPSADDLLPGVVSDSYQAAPCTDNARGAPRLLDVGSGAGLPGVVIAICCPDIRVDCVDTVGKKAAFIQQVAVTLKLPNLRGVHARVENLTEKYQVISSRAFASLLDFTNWSVKALAEQGVWMAMKGKHPADEMTALPPSVEMFHVEQLLVPGLDAERCVIWIRPYRSL